MAIESQVSTLVSVHAIPVLLRELESRKGCNCVHGNATIAGHGSIRSARRGPMPPPTTACRPHVSC